MGEVLVSVIIPVYKAERFLDACLKSVISQDYPALEIILVDDGSPDSCPEMCERYAEDYGNIKTIHKANEGPGPARNAGLEAAIGKYVAFVDSDDLLDGREAIRRLVERAEEKQADIAVGAYRRLYGSRFGGIRRHRLGDTGCAGTTDFRFRGFVVCDHLIPPWCKLYRRAFLSGNGLAFRNYPFGEDKSFNMMCCACRPVYAFVDESVYLYRANDESITFRYRDYVSVYTAIARDFEAFLFGRGLAKEYGDLAAFHLCIGLSYLAIQELGNGGIAETARALSRYGRDPLVRRTAGELARCMYLNQVGPDVFGKKAKVWGASLLCVFHAYAVLALGVWALQKAVSASEAFSGIREARRRPDGERRRMRSMKGSGK